jgi:hypothetical protein
MTRRIAAALIASLSFASCDREPADDPGRPYATFGPDTSIQMPPGRLAAPAAGIARDSLIGAWSADGENFVWVIERDSILFEADMLRHPYQVSGDTLLIDRQDPTIGVQKTRVTRVTADSLYITDATHGSSEVLIKLR